MSETKAKKISVVIRRGENFKCGAIGFDFSKFDWICEKVHPNPKWSLLLMMHQEIAWRVETKVDN